MKIADSPSMTVKEAIQLLRCLPPDYKLKIWLPGSHIYLSCGTAIQKSDYPGTVFFEGNVEPGSALDDLTR